MPAAAAGLLVDLNGKSLEATRRGIEKATPRGARSGEFLRRQSYAEMAKFVNRGRWQTRV